MDTDQASAARAPCEKDLITMTEAIRDLTCRHLLGALPGNEYRETLVSLLAECRRRFPPQHRPQEEEFLVGESY